MDKEIKPAAMVERGLLEAWVLALKCPSRLPSLIFHAFFHNAYIHVNPCLMFGLKKLEDSQSHI